MGRLSHVKIKSLKERGRYPDGGTLYLQVGPTGSRSWIQRVVINGRRRDIGLGGYGVVSLEKARRKAFDNRVKIADGIDVLVERRRSTSIPTFETAALQYFEENLPAWKQNRNAKKWIHVVRQYAFKAFGTVQVDRITREEVLRLLKPLATRKPEQFRKLKQRLRVVFGWCQANGFVQTNVVDEIQAALPRVPTVRQHFRAMPYQDVPKALKTIEGSGASWSSKWCLRFLILTASRSIEARGVRWDEIDWSKKIWTVPMERMKMKEPHQVPLSTEALAVFKQAWTVREDDNGLVFPSSTKRGTMLADMTLTKLLRGLGLAKDATVHGFRSSFRDFGNEQTNFDCATLELALSHRVGSAVERSYSRSTLVAKRSRLMQAWSDFATGKKISKADVVRLRVGV